jgi:hypothetical protein
MLEAAVVLQITLGDYAALKFRPALSASAHRSLPQILIRGQA